MSKVSASLVAIGLSAGCGGGGPTTPQAPSVTLSGTVVSTQTGRPIAGASIITSAGTLLATADGAGQFSIRREGAGESRIAIRVSAPGYLSRDTGLRAETHAAITIDLIALEAPFSLDLYRQLVRNAYDLRAQTPPFDSRGVTRWTTNPSVYICTNRLPLQSEPITQSLDDPVPQLIIDTATEAIPRLIREISGGRVALGRLEMGPQYRPRADGWITVGFFDGGGGFGSLNEAGNRGNVFVGYSARSRTCLPFFDPSTLAHELGHAMGLSHVAPDADLQSDMTMCNCNRRRGPCEVLLTAVELYHSAILYSRPIRNQDPDVDPFSFSF